ARVSRGSARSPLASTTPLSEPGGSPAATTGAGSASKKSDAAIRGRVLVVINTATYAPSAAASAARSDDEGDAGEHRPRREAPCDEAEQRLTRARSDPRRCAGRRSGSRPAGATWTAAQRLWRWPRAGRRA